MFTNSANIKLYISGMNAGVHCTQSSCTGHKRITEKSCIDFRKQQEKPTVWPCLAYVLNEPHSEMTWN